MIKFLKQIQQSLCEHVVNYTLALKRDLQGNVHARCLKCGKDLHADCYLNMDARLVRNGKPKLK